MIADEPGAGRLNLDALDDRHRFWPVYSFLIVYRWRHRPIEVIAIVHGARDLPTYFQPFRDAD